MITIFFDQLKKLCSERGTTPTALCKTLGLSTALPTNWKNGRVPNSSTLQRIADHFGVSTDYLLGKENPPSRGDVIFTPKEAELMRRMQELDDDQAQQLLEYMEFLIQQRKKKN